MVPILRWNCGTDNRRTGHTFGPLWVWQKGCPGNQLELCATHWAPTNSMARMPRSSQIWRPSLVCTSQPHSARNDDLLLLLGSTVQSSIIHSPTGGSTLPFLSSGIEWIRYIHPRFQTCREMPPSIYLSIPSLLLPFFYSSLPCTVMVIAAG